MIFSNVYFLIQYIVVAVLMVVIVAMSLRLFFNFRDPNPFGQVGRFSYWLKKKTDDWVRPVASWLAMGGFNTKWAPLVTMLVACVLGWFLIQAAYAITYTLDGVIMSVQSGRLVSLVGFLLFGFLALLELAIIIRIVFSWVGYYGNRFTRFLSLVTDPILLPFRRLIPPIGGVLDISPVIVLIILGFLQQAVKGTLIGM